MSLLGALSLGSASLAAQQVGLEVTGNNLANAGTTGYSRQVVRLAPGDPRQIAPGEYVGTGVTVTSIERQVNAAIDSSLRDATSSMQGSQTTSDLLNRVQTVFDALGDNNLSSRVQQFFDNFNTLANNPQDPGQRSVVIQGGLSLASYIKDLRTRLLAIRDDTQSQIQALATQAGTLVQQVAQLNGQISSAEAAGGNANTLRDQRDQTLSQLSEIMDIRVIDTGNGMVNVLCGSTPMVDGTTARGISIQQGTDPTGTLAQTNLVFDNGDLLPVNGGKLGALVGARDNQLAQALSTLDAFANTLITTVNAVHSQGQGLTGFTSVTGATQVLNPNVALNDPSLAPTMPSTPVNGTFNIQVKDLNTGLITTQQITVNVTSTTTPTTLNSLANDLNAAGIAAAIDPTGHLQIVASGNTSLTFSDDTSGVLAALGINTFFTGKGAQDIGVNATLTSTPGLLASGRGNTPGSNANAQAIALTYTAANAALGGISLQDYYNNYMADLASGAKTAGDDAKAQATIHDSLFAQREAISGVSIDEEAINLTKYQRAFQGTARYISVINDMMDVVLGLVK